MIFVEHEIGNGWVADVTDELSVNKKTKRTLKIRQRRVSCKVKGSKNRKKAAVQVGRLHKKICVACGHMAHADINAAKNIKELAVSNIASTVLGDSKELEPRGSKRPKQCQETSARSMSFPC